MFSSLFWVPRGFHRSVPITMGLEAQDVSAMKAELETEVGPIETDGPPMLKPKAKKDDVEIPPELAEFDFEHYDDSDEEIVAAGSDEEQAEEESGTRMYGAGMSGQMYHASNAEDPYVTGEFEDSDDEIDDKNIRPEDSMLITARAGGEEGSALLVNVYDPDNGTTYVHHDIPLVHAPLSLAWCDFNNNEPTRRANVVAVGGMGNLLLNSRIDLYDVDINAMYVQLPLATLRDKKVKAKKQSAESVLSLSWNKTHRNVLASGGTDKTIRIWDMGAETCLKDYTRQLDKIQSVNWNHIDCTVLLTGAYSGHLSVFDSRQDETKKVTTRMDSDIESTAWCPNQSNYFIASTEKGSVACFDTRIIEKPLFSMHCSSRKKDPVVVSWSPRLPNLICSVAQVSMECMAWEIDIAKSNAVCLATRILTDPEEEEEEMSEEEEEDDVQARLFCVQFCPDDPATVAVGGSNSTLSIWDMTEKSAVEQVFHFTRPPIGWIYVLNIALKHKQVFQQSSKNDKHAAIHAEVSVSFGDLKMEESEESKGTLLGAEIGKTEKKKKKKRSGRKK